MDFTSLVKLVVPSPCFEEYFSNFNFLHSECFKIVLSKCLGYGIILFSMIVKLPQILKIWNARSGKGVSIISVSLELFAISAGVAYGYASRFPFSAYGEGVFLAFQTVLIAFLVLLFGSSTLVALLYTAIYVVAMGTLLSPAVPFSVLSAMQAANIPIVIISKMLQAVTNYRAGSTGQLSAITMGLMTLGAIARIFTSVQETGDQQVILTYCFASLCNAIIFGQILYYSGSKAHEGATQPRQADSARPRQKPKKAE